jgi:hypothetical protein
MLQRFTLSRTVRTLLIAAVLAVCLAPLPAQDTKATVLNLIGRVSVMTDARGYYEQPLSQGMSVRPQQLIVTGPDGYAQFQVSDGSTFEVFSNARVMFRPTLGNWKDLLNVVLGRVKVFIQHGPGGAPNHNKVSSPTAVISVRGTVFDVVVEDADGTTLVSVDEGLVTVRNMTAVGNTVYVNPGGYVRVFRDVPLALVKPDKSNAVQVLLKATRDAFWQIMRNRQAGGVAGGPGTVPGGAQGDKNKTPGAPGTPPQLPGGH